MEERLAVTPGVAEPLRELRFVIKVDGPSMAETRGQEVELEPGEVEAAIRKVERAEVLRLRNRAAPRAERARAEKPPGLEPEATLSGREELPGAVAALVGANTGGPEVEPLLEAQ